MKKRSNYFRLIIWFLFIAIVFSPFIYTYAKIAFEIFELWIPVLKGIIAIVLSIGFVWGLNILLFGLRSKDRD